MGKYKRFTALTVIAMLLSVSGCAPGERTVQTSNFYDYGLNPASTPQVLTEQDLDFQTVVDSLAGLAGKDLGEKDLTLLPLEVMAGQTFDVNTAWPQINRLPAGFAPADWLEAAKDPGLGIRDLHRRGVTGKGVSVAVFDKPILYGHSEFAGRITYIEVAPKTKKGWNVHFHGISTASILAGKECGVAPEATLYYFAVPNAGNNFHYYSLAMEELLRINKALPEGEKIRIVSISDGSGPGEPGWKEWQKAEAKAAEQGVAVFYSNTAAAYGFSWGGCPPYLDTSDPANFALSKYLSGMANSHETIIIPGDYRTTAGNSGPADYIYWGNGGYSWAIPYVAGLAALAWQVSPGLSFEEIAALLEKTKEPVKDGFVVNPLRFISEVK